MQKYTLIDDAAKRKKRAYAKRRVSKPKLYEISDKKISASREIKSLIVEALTGKIQKEGCQLPLEFGEPGRGTLSHNKAEHKREVLAKRKEALEKGEVSIPTLCEISAGAKGIHVSEELKSLVIETKKEKEKKYWMVHLPGDKELNYEEVRRILDVEKVQLVNEETLLKLFGAQPGTTNPFTNNELKKLPQLLSEDLFFKEKISTNAGNLDDYLLFSPALLLSKLLCHCKNESERAVFIGSISIIKSNQTNNDGYWVCSLLEGFINLLYLKVKSHVEKIPS